METTPKTTRELPGLVKRYVENVQKTNPAVKVLSKQDSKLMQLLGWFFRVTKISPAFMEQYYTTIGSTVYVPDQAYTTDPQRLLEVVMHECLHAADNKRWPGLFPLSYLAPQVFAVFSLLAFLAPVTSPLMWLWLLALLFLLPIPSPARYWWELRAYRTSVLFARLVYGCKDEEMQWIYSWVVGQLATKFYYFAWPFPKMIESDLKNETFMQQPDYQQMVEFLKKEKLIPKAS